jgi:hypothetical protein
MVTQLLFQLTGWPPKAIGKFSLSKLKPDVKLASVWRDVKSAAIGIPPALVCTLKRVKCARVESKCPVVSTKAASEANLDAWTRSMIGVTISILQKSASFLAKTCAPINFKEWLRDIDYKYNNLS